MVDPPGGVSIWSVGFVHAFGATSERDDGMGPQAIDTARRRSAPESARI
jgi:hypothetical protein